MRFVVFQKRKQKLPGESLFFRFLNDFYRILSSLNLEIFNLKGVKTFQKLIQLRGVPEILLERRDNTERGGGGGGGGGCKNGV